MMNRQERFLIGLYEALAEREEKDIMTDNTEINKDVHYPGAGVDAVAEAVEAFRLLFEKLGRLTEDQLHEYDLTVLRFLKENHGTYNPS